MLEKLLKRIRQGGAFSIQMLAREFEVSEGLIESMLDDLARAGLIKSNMNCEETSCNGCHFQVLCKPHERIWTLTEKRNG